MNKLKINVTLLEVIYVGLSIRESTLRETKRKEKVRKYIYINGKQVDIEVTI